jgi:hypothetical protein
MSKKIRQPEHTQTCFCGNGQIIVFSVSLDHSYFDPRNEWYDHEITCDKCNNEYQIENRSNGDIIAVKRTDVSDSQNNDKRAKQAECALLSSEAVQTLAQQFEELIYSRGTVRKANNTLKAVGITEKIDDNTIKYGNLLHKWIKARVRTDAILPMMKLLGVEDSDLTAHVEQVQKLRQIVVDPYRTAIVIYKSNN